MDSDTMIKINKISAQNNENCVKFGEIFLTGNGKFKFICNFCNEVFYKSILLTGHVIGKHATTDIESIKEAFFTNSTDFEQIENYNLNKLSIHIELANSETNNMFCELQNKDANLNYNSQKFPEIKITSLNYENDKINIVKKNTTGQSSCKTEKLEIKKKRMRLLNGKVYWQCPICNVVLKCTSKYDHLKRHTGKTTFKCKYCNEEFSTKVRRRNHEKIHTGEVDRPIQCPDCPKNFKSKVILTNHIRRDHLGIREHKCDYCDKRFYLKVEKISHERSNHTKEKPCICEICGLSFRVQQKLNTHMQNHNEPKFQCDKCNKKFYAKANLKRHQICHSNLKPYTCDICSANFPRLCAYKTHIKLHSDIKEYICRFCNKDYYDISGISCHMKSAHKMQYNKINVLRRSLIKEND